ncbi:MAG TPA: peptidoglycan-binding domain-containing protein [Candidatus Paceibacterota bacterium]
METLKFWLTTIIVLALLGGLGYFAFTSIDSGSEHVNRQKIKELQSENEDLVKQVESLEKKLEAYEPKVVEEPVVQNKPPVQTEPTKTTAPAVYKHAKLIAELEALVADNVQMKLKSRGTRVGTVQNFLNLYINTTNKVDNDYGESTKKAVIAFQKAVGLSPTGEAGPTTFNKMIEWLKKQG